jgi:hypothetical protein
MFLVIFLMRASKEEERDEVGVFAIFLLLCEVLVRTGFLAICNVILDFFNALLDEIRNWSLLLDELVLFFDAVDC